MMKNPESLENRNENQRLSQAIPEVLALTAPLGRLRPAHGTAMLSNIAATTFSGVFSSASAS